MYPKWWNKTLTVYNRYQSGNIVVWYHTVLTGCFFAIKRSHARIGETDLTSVSVIARIRQSAAFVEKVVWDALDDKTIAFTLSPNDIIVNGEVNDTIDEYTAGQRSTDLIERYKAQGCMRVENYSHNADVDCPHLYVSGV